MRPASSCSRSRIWGCFCPVVSDRGCFPGYSSNLSFSNFNLFTTFSTLRSSLNHEHTLFLAFPRFYLLFSFGDAGQSGAVALMFTVPFLLRVLPAPWWGCHFFVAFGEVFNPTFPEEILTFVCNLSFN